MMKDEQWIPVSKNEEIEVEVIGFGSAGEGIAKVEGYTLFIKGGVPGDCLLVRVIKIKKRHGYAKLLRVLSESSKRKQPTCPAGQACGGCTLDHVAYDYQLFYKQQMIEEAFLRIGHFQKEELVPVILPIIGMDAPYAYRNKVQFPIRPRIGDSQPAIGFFAPGSHRLIERTDCQLQLPTVDQLAKQLQSLLIEYQVSAYDEKRGRGMARHCVIRYSAKQQQYHLMLVVNADYLSNCVRQVLIKLYQQNSNLAGVSVNYQTAQNNVIVGRQTKMVAGNQYLIDRIALEEISFDFRLSPTSFYQVNMYQTGPLYQTVLDLAKLTKDELVFDLYCGIGTISLFLASQAQAVYGIEVVAAAIDDAKQNAELNGCENAFFRVGQVERELEHLVVQGRQPDCVVVDPPRKGLASSVIDTLNQIQPSRIVYVSCNPATQARDCRLLVDGGGYQLKALRGVDMFGMGVHVETVALLSK